MAALVPSRHSFSVARLAIGALVLLLAAAALPARGEASASGSSGPEVVPGEMVVGYEAAARPDVRARAHRAVGVARSHGLAVPRAELVAVPRGLDLERARSVLESEPGVAFAEPNYVRELRLVPSSPLFSVQWALGGILDALHVNARGAWEITTGSPSVTLAVVDDGVDVAHRDLAPNVSARSWDFVDDDADPTPPGGADHGTHVAGIAGAVGDNGYGVAGMSWRLDLLAMRIFGSGGRTTTARIASAFSRASQLGARVINASFGGPWSSQVESEAIAGAPRTLFAVATANQNTNFDQPGVADYPCDYPHPNIICVTASNQLGQKAGFAGWGPRSVDIAAPGASIMSTVPGGHAPKSGTSMATPHVAGTAALMLAVDPELSARQLRTLLMQSVDRTPELEGQVGSGGRLNAQRAVALARIVEGQPGVAQGRPAAAVKPRSRIVQRPARQATTRRAAVRLRFRFRGNDDAQRFVCRLRGASRGHAATRRCSRGVAYRVPARPRARTFGFQVAAVGAGGVREADPSSARVTIRRR